MSNFLQSIIARHISPVPPLQPRLYNRFEPVAAEEPLTGEVKEMNTQTSTVASPQTEMISQPSSISIASKATTSSIITERSLLSETTHTNHVEQPAGNLIDEIGFKPTATLPVTQHDEVIKDAHKVEPKLLTKEPIGITNNVYHSNFHKKDIEQLHNERRSLLNAAPVSIAMNPFSDDMYKPDSVNTQGHSVIKVTIGRVDVRANASAQPAKSQGVAQANTKMSLEDYFKRKATPDR